MNEPKLLVEKPVHRRVRIPKAAGAELAARYRIRAEAERQLVDFLRGVVLAKGIGLEDVQGFDDATNELLLRLKP